MISCVTHGDHLSRIRWGIVAIRSSYKKRRHFQSKLSFIWKSTNKKLHDLKRMPKVSASWIHHRDAEAPLTFHLKPQKIWNFCIFTKILRTYQPKLKTLNFVIFGVELRMSRNQFFNIFAIVIYCLFNNKKPFHCGSKNLNRQNRFKIIK